MGDTPEKIDSEINNTLSLLDKFDANNIITKGLQNLVLFIGLTGSGKSTVSSYLASETNLTVDSKYGIYKVLGPRIGTNNSVSQTLYPDLVNSNTNVTELKHYSLVDCPGFEDSRNPSIDIAGTVFIKTLLAKAESVKFAIVVRYNNLFSRDDRTKLADLTRQLNTFFNSTKRLEDNFCLIVNMVPEGKKKEDIINFLNDEYKDGRDAFLDVITKNNGEKMEYFHIANQVGDMDNIVILKDDKKRIFDMIEKNVKYMNPTSHTFGSPIHYRTEIYVTELYSRIYKDMTREISKVQEKLYERLNEKEAENHTFYQLVSAISGLDLAAKPRTNLLHQMQKFDSTVAKGLATQENYLEMMKQLPAFKQEQQENDGIVDGVKSFLTMIKDKLNDFANNLHKSAHKSLANCIDGVLKTAKKNGNLPHNYPELEEILSQEVEKLANIKTSLSAPNQPATKMLNLLHDSRYKDSDVCNSLGESLDKIQNSTYVDIQITKNLTEEVSKFVCKVQEEVITFVTRDVWTQFLQRVDSKVSIIQTTLIDELKKLVDGTDEREERQKKFAMYLDGINNLKTNAFIFESFHDKLKSFALSIVEINMTDLVTDYQKLEEKKNDQVKEFITRQEVFGRNLNEVHEYIKNSAPTQPSFINAAIKWVKSQMFPMLPGSNGRNHGASCSTYQLDDWNPTILLLDLIVRQFTRSKPQPWISNTSCMDVLEVQAHTLNIIDEIEVCQRYDEQLDFVSVQTKLHKRLSQLDDPADVVFIRDETLRMINGPYSV